MSTHLNASRPTGRRDRLKAYENERVCSEEGCSTRLSKYNRSEPPADRRHSPKPEPANRQYAEHGPSGT